MLAEQFLKTYMPPIFTWQALAEGYLAGISRGVFGEQTFMVEAKP